MPKKPQKRNGEHPKRKRNEKGAEEHAHAGKGSAEWIKRLDAVAFRPYDKRWDDLAKEIGLTPRGLRKFRDVYSDDIEARLREWFVEARPSIDKAILESCIGFTSENRNFEGQVSLKQYPPNAVSIQTFYERCEKFLDKHKDERADVLFGIDPQMHQVLPLFHWDKKWGTNGNDQLVAWFSGRGGGKTKIGARKILKLAKLNRGTQLLVCAPTYKMLSNPVLEYLKSALEDCKIPNQYWKQDNYFILWGDTKIICRSFEDADKIRGLEVSAAWIDELREGDKDAIDTILACVRDPRATLRQTFVTSTPNGYDFMWDIWGDPESKTLRSGRAVAYFSRTDDNVFLPPSFIDMLMETYDEQVIKQELLGQFVNVSQKNIYYNFDRATHVGNYEFDPNLPIHIGHDFNYNPLCAVVFQIHDDRGRKVVWVVDELYMDSSSTDEECKELKIREGSRYDPSRYPPEWIANYPDASGVQKTAAAGARSNIEILRQHGYTNLKHPHANCFIRDRYASVNGMLRNANGHNRLFINSKCRHLIRDLEQESYKQGSNLRDDSTTAAKARGHITDALGYGIHYLFRIESSFTAYSSY